MNEIFRSVEFNETASPQGQEAAVFDFLRAAGLADGTTIERAKHVAAETGKPIDTILTKLGILTEQRLAEVFSEVLDLPLASSDRYPHEPVLADLLKANFLRRSRVLPIGLEHGGVMLAMVNPLDHFTRDVVTKVVDLPVSVLIALPLDLENALDRLYPLEGATEATEANPSFRAGSEDDAERLKDLASEAPVVKLVNQLIVRAVETLASDIHLEPLEDRMRVRYRYDGVMHEDEGAYGQYGTAIVSRIKIMAQLDIAERRLPQDGRLRMAVRGQEVDFRVSTLPSIYGESVVLRVLDRGAISFDFVRLGLQEELTRSLRDLLNLPNGIVLVTGPTGSGKTTTLYTGLLALNAVTRKIITAEDPVEYRLSGINQIQVKPQIGLTFASLLRSILRQDPDVIMIGEIRDIETAQIAVQASLTGHLVLSTLHTNSAASTIIRLRDMGLEPYLITAALRGVLAQRLVRRLCPACARPQPASDAVIQRFSLDRRHEHHPIILHHAVGCPECRGTGFKGRLAIAELLIPDEEIERLVLDGAGHLEIERAAVKAGMRTMFEAGIDAALAGVTSIEEVVRTMSAESIL